MFKSNTNSSSENHTFSSKMQMRFYQSIIKSVLQGAEEVFAEEDLHPKVVSQLCKLWLDKLQEKNIFTLAMEDAKWNDTCKYLFERNAFKFSQNFHNNLQLSNDTEGMQSTSQKENIKSNINSRKRKNKTPKKSRSKKFCGKNIESKYNLRPRAKFDYSEIDYFDLCWMSEDEESVDTKSIQATIPANGLSLGVIDCDDTFKIAPTTIKDTKEINFVTRKKTPIYKQFNAKNYLCRNRTLVNPEMFLPVKEKIVDFDSYCNTSEENHVKFSHKPVLIRNNKLKRRTRRLSKLKKRIKHIQEEKVNEEVKNEKIFKIVDNSFSMSKILVYLPDTNGKKRSCLLNVNLSLVKNDTLQSLLKPLIKRVANFSDSEASYVLQKSLDNNIHLNVVPQIDGLVDKFRFRVLPARKYVSNSKPKRGRNKRSIEINSDDDLSDCDVQLENQFECATQILCQYVTVKRRRNIFNVFLNHGIITINGMDYFFSKAHGQLVWN